MKKVLLASISLFLFALIVRPSFAVSPNGNGTSDETGKSTLYLFQKENFVQDGWTIVEKGAWGKMEYNLEGETFDFVFNGHKLKANEDYTLIYYPDPWPGDGLICLGEGTSNKGKNVHIEGSKETGNMPAPYDKNFGEGAKIWLVLSDNVKCDGGNKMTGWRPNDYLFEYDLINYDYYLTLNLWPKDSSWNIVTSGAHGILKYEGYGDEFVFQFEATGLESLSFEDFSLIYWPDGLTKKPLVGEGKKDDYGNLLIKGSLNFDSDLPFAGDSNTGAKIWLVPSDRYNKSTETLQFFRSEILFEENLINYSDTDK